MHGYPVGYVLNNRDKTMQLFNYDSFVYIMLYS